MSCQREWFATFEYFEGGSMLMDNNTPCKMVSIDYVWIRMHHDKI